MPSTRRGNCFAQLFSLSSCFALQFSSCPQFSTVSSRRALSPRRHPPPPPPVQGSSPFWTQFSKDAVDFQRGRCGLQSSIRDLSAWSSTRWPSFSTRGHPLGSRHALISAIRPWPEARDLDKTPATMRPTTRDYFSLN